SPILVGSTEEALLVTSSRWSRRPLCNATMAVRTLVVLAGGRGRSAFCSQTAAPVLGSTMMGPVAVTSGCARVTDGRSPAASAKTPGLSPRIFPLHRPDCRRAHNGMPAWNGQAPRPIEAHVDGPAGLVLHSGSPPSAPREARCP